ncbi:zinc finger protein 622 [Wolffia australiana]
MPGVLSCNACNKEFVDETQQKLHYKSEWHRYNLKRKVAGLPGVTEALFQARQLALAEEKNSANAQPMSYSCVLCGKEYRSSKALDQHLKSKAHIVKASQGSTSFSQMTNVKPLPNHSSGGHATTGRSALKKVIEHDEDEESEDEWVEIDSNDESFMNLDGEEDETDDDDGMDEVFDASCCFICDSKHETIEACVVHMHKQHGFFIPDIEYLKDVEGFLTYLALKVMKDFRCLYCNDRCHPFQSLEAVRKHMIAKGHCKVRYGNGDDDEDDEEVELEEFYDYSSSYENENGNQIVVADEANQNIELGYGGSELIITQRSENRVLVKTFGSREFLRYYRQKPRPSASGNVPLHVSLALRYRNMCLATVQSKQDIVRSKIQRAMSRTGDESQKRSLKMGMKSNVIRNLPKNVPF